MSVADRMGDRLPESALVRAAVCGALIALAIGPLVRSPVQVAISPVSPPGIPASSSYARQPSLCANAVEETLRFDPPSQYQGRVTTRDVTLHGVAIPAGSRVLLVNGATGRDERQFPYPDRYDVRREIDTHLGFSRHLCIGAWLARLESRIGIEEFLRRWPRCEVPEDGVERMHSSNVRGFSGLVIEPR